MLGDEGLVDAFVAEHVWEHLSLQDAHRATRSCQRYLRPGGRLRLAVPDPAFYSSASPGFSSIPTASPTQISNTSGFEKSDGGDSVASDEPEGGGSQATAEEGRDDSDMNVPHRELSRGENFRGKHESSSGEFEVSLKGIPINQEEMSSSSGSPAMPADNDLPRWLSRDMLLADARDGHLVQFTPELLANVCWSAGLTPVLVEGGGGDRGGGVRDRVHPPSPSSRKAASTSTTTTASGVTEGEVVVPGFENTAGPAYKNVGEEGDESVVCEGAANHQRRGDVKDLRHQKPSSPRTGFPIASEDKVEEEVRHHRWGLISRSVAGGDPRGAVSIVMDCIKPSSKNEEEGGLRDAVHRPEVLRAGGGIDSNSKSPQRPAEQNPNDFHPIEISKNISPPKYSSSSFISSVLSQQRPFVVGTGLSSTVNLPPPTKTADKIEDKRVSIAAAATGITLGIGYVPSYGFGAGVGVGGGVVAVGTGATAAAPAATSLKVNHPNFGDSGTTSTSVRMQVLRRPAEKNEFGGGVGVAMGVATTGCRGLLCDGAGQSGDAAGSGEGG